MGAKRRSQNFALDELQQVVGFFFVALGIGVARDSEHLTGGDGQAREQQVQVVGHHVFERHEVALAAESQQARDTLTDGHLRFAQ